jgi:hypothetical protein
MDKRKPIRLSGHAKDQLRFRGCTVEEIQQAIHSAQWKKAEMERWECKHEIQFHEIWNGKKYSHKQIRPIFAEEEDEIVVVTVYVYYSNR